MEKRVTCGRDACTELASGATLRVQKKSPGWGTIQGIFKMRRVAPRVAPKLLVLIPIKPAGASTKATYVGAGAGACVRIDWIGLRTTIGRLQPPKYPQHFSMINGNGYQNFIFV